jgi:hypothetical protein
MKSPVLEPEENIQYPLWQSPLLTALMETDREKAQARIAEARAAIYGRLQVITQGANHHAEHEALRDALAILRVIENERQKAS